MAHDESIGIGIIIIILSILGFILLFSNCVDPNRPMSNICTCHCAHDWEICICEGREYRLVPHIQPIEAKNE